MAVKKDELEELIALASAAFADRKRTAGLPKLHSFPFDCCEVSSVHLALSLSLRFSSESIRVVEGYIHQKNRHHFWVKISGFTIDVAPDDLTGVDGPICSDAPHPWEALTSDLTSRSPKEAWDYFEKGSQELASNLLN